MKKIILISLCFLASCVLNAQSSSCSTAPTITTGLHTANNASGDQWYKYTNGTTGPQLVTVSSCTYTNFDTELYIYTACNTSSVAYSDDACGSQSTASYTLNAGQTLYINWSDSYTSSSYQWNLTATAVSGGAVCSTAKTAVLGSNNANNTLGDDWFVYTNTTSALKEINISTCNLTTNDTKVLVYNSCTATSTIASSDDYCSSQSQVRVSVAAGQSIYINWTNDYTNTTYNWNLSEVVLQAGADCAAPKTAVLGTNSANNANNNDQWFTFTNTSSQRKRYVATSCNLTTSDTYVKLQSTCSGSIITSSDAYCNSQGQVSFFLNPNESILINWDGIYTTATYNWTLSEEAIITGSDCAAPKTAVVGTNSANNSLGDDWFTYTNTSSSAKNISVSTCNTATADTKVQIFNSCSATSTLVSSDDFCSSQSQAGLIVAAGQTIYINWTNDYTTATYNWTLSEVAIQAGTDCATPKTAVLGSNSAINTNNLDQWFTYTNTSSQKKRYVATTCNLTTNDTYVKLQSTCLGSTIASSDSYCNSQGQVTFDLNPNESILINWDGSYTSATYNWTLSEVVLTAGSDCSMPKTAAVGTNSANNLNGDEWFTYTNTSSSAKNITVSTCNTATTDTKVLVYNSCSTTSSLASSDDYCSSQSQASLIVTAGQTIYINWTNDYTSSAYNWTLSEATIQVGSDCSVPKTAVLGTNSANNSTGDQWFTYTNTSTQKKRYIATSCNLTSEDTYLQIKSSCSGSIIASSDSYCGAQSNLTFDLNPNESMLINWDGAYTSATYNWTLSEVVLTAGSDCAVPKTAVVGTNNANNSVGDDWFTYTNTSSSAKNITVSSCNLTSADTKVQIFNSCSATSTITSSDDYCSSQSQTSFNVAAGQTIYINWTNDYTSSTFSWTLSETVTTIPQGSECSVAKPITAGSQQFIPSADDLYWYIYTNNSGQTQQVTASSCSTTSADTYLAFLTECGSSAITYDDNCSTQSTGTQNLASGQKIYILWINNSGTNFNWNLTVQNASGINKKEALEIDVYPTFVHDFVNLSTLVSSVKVYSTSGVLVNEYKNVDRLDFSSFTSGTYLLEILEDNKVSNQRVVKE
jgi:hypothetical protein